MKQNDKVFVSCGCCCQYHRFDYTGDCRNDNARFSLDDIEDIQDVIILEEDDEGWYVDKKPVRG